MAFQAQKISISKPNLPVIGIPIEGTAPFVQHKFSQKALNGMLETQMQEGVKSKKRSPRKPKEEMEAAIHYSKEGWVGIPAPAFRSAMISACRLLGFPMTKAKISVFVEADGFDATDGTPLVKLIAGKPEMNQSAVRLATGVASIAIRPMWREWGAIVRVRYDADQFSAEDVSNLLWRAGEQVGIGEGRPDSRDSHGMGWGTFRIADVTARPKKRKVTKT